MATPSKDVSVVLQGPVHRVPNAREGLNLTSHCLKSVRHALPDAELILSTWDGEDCSGLDYDKLVQSPDPGPCDDFIPLSQNVNRQLVSSLAGLKAATRPYAAKVRSDTIVEFPAFLEYPGRYPERGKGKVVFGEKVLASAMGTSNFRQVGLFYALSDFFFFGRTPDLVALFDVPPAARPPGRPPHTGPWVSEQYLMVEVMNKAGIPVGPAGPWPGSYRRHFRWWLAWERFLFANFILAHPSHLGLLLPRRLYMHHTGYTWWRFDILYKMYCERPGALLPLPARELLTVLACYLWPPRKLGLA